MSGFKELRFVVGRAFPADVDSVADYAQFTRFMAFLRSMCLDVKASRSSKGIGRCEAEVEQTGGLHVASAAVVT